MGSRIQDNRKIRCF